MIEHPLNEPVWSSLGSDHAHFAISDDHIRRYDPEIGPITAIKDTSDQSMTGLRDSVDRFGLTVLAQSAKTLADFAAPSGVQITWDRPAVQMVFGSDDVDGASDDRIEALTAGDAAQMLSLALLTKPGPFAERTHEMGHYWGIKRDGRLIAMAGERFRQPGYTEVSAICTHPEFEGQGLGRSLTIHTLRAILARGEVPYLHAFSDNARALGLYEALGFRWRQDMRGVALDRA